MPNANARAEHRTHRYYDTQWQLLEERIDAAYRLEPDGDEYSGGEEQGGPWDWSGTGFASAFGHSRTVARQYIWDPTGGVDELVQVRAAPTPTAPASLGAASFTQGFWALTDKSHSVIGYLPTSGGGTAERVAYRAYGTPILAATGDADGNGTVAFSDNSAVLAGFNGVVGNPYPGGAYTARADVNQDGAITFADTTFIFANFGKSQRYDRVSRPGADATRNGIPFGEEGFQPALDSGSVIGYAGSVWDPEAQLCLMRHRWHDPNLARWLTRDPAGYVDGMSLYVYVKGNPLVYVDPFGLRAECKADAMQDRRIRDLLEKKITPAQYREQELAAADGAFTGAMAAATFVGLPLSAGELVAAGAVAVGTKVGTRVAAKYGPKLIGAASRLLSKGDEAADAAKVVGKGADEAASGTAGAIKRTREEVLEANKSQGAAWEQQVLDEARQTQDDVVEQITVKTREGVKTKLDSLGHEKGTTTVVAQEAKSSSTAPLTANQSAAFPSIAEHGAEVVGRGKPPFVGGTKIPPITVQIKRPPQP